MNPGNKPIGLYISLLRFLLNLPILFPLWALIRWLFKDKIKLTLTIDRETKLHPSVAEGYQIIMLAIVSVALWQMPNTASFFLAVAWYRAWEIFIIGLKWLLVDKASLHSSRRSLVSFTVNLLEISIIFTVAGYPLEKVAAKQQFWQVLENIGLAFKLEKPPLNEPMATLFLIESAIFIIFVLACVIGGIQKKTWD